MRDPSLGKEVAALKTRVLTSAAAGIILALTIGSPAYAASVSAGDNFYDPETVTVAVGETVTWTNVGQQPHTVTANDGSFDSSPSCPEDVTTCMQSGDTYSQSFSEPGTIAYFCKVHGQSMSGTVVVQGGTDESPDPTDTPGELPATGPGNQIGTLAAIGAIFLVMGALGLWLFRKRETT